MSLASKIGEVARDAPDEPPSVEQDDDEFFMDVLHEDEVAVAVRAGAPRHPDNVWWCGVTVTLPLIPTYPLRAGCGGRGGSVSGHGTGHDDRGRR